jgi:ABC-2 type transport system ATP-binding protein
MNESPDATSFGAGRAAVSITDLHVKRGKNEVLRGLSLTVPRGQVVGLLGPSGSGKTTLMRAIVGVQRVTSGSVTVLGDAAGSSALRRVVGYVTQAASVYDDLTVQENLAYFRRVLDAPKGDIDRVLGQTDLTTNATQLVSRLSGGQRTRVSLAAALLGSPQLLVLDEPTVGLDPVLRVELWSLFHELAEKGTSLLVSSHVMDEATRCDRLLLMRGGALLADDTLDGLLRTTNAPDVEQAFLALVRNDVASQSGHPAARASEEER